MVKRHSKPVKRHKTEPDGRHAPLPPPIKIAKEHLNLYKTLRMARLALDPLSLATFWVAEDASIVYVNRAACRSLGYSRRELLALKIMDIDPDFSRRRWTRHWNSGKLSRARLIETMHRTKDGRVFPVEVAISAFSVGGRQYHCDFVKDITDRRQTEAEQDKARRALDDKVRERTAELHATIQALRKAAAYRKRIERALRDHQHQLRSLVSELAVAEGQERQRIATGIHDDISQMLAAAKLKTGQLGKRMTTRSPSRKLVNDLERILNQVLDSSRSLTFDLASPVLHRIGLEAALDDLCDRMRMISTVEFAFVSDRKAKPAGTAIQELVFQSVKELMRNVINHAQAKQAKVSLTRRNNALRVVVSDDGIGFDESSLKGFRPTGGFGLDTIRERIHYLGGHFSIRPVSPHGSSVILTVPLSSQRSEPV